MTILLETDVDGISRQTNRWNLAYRQVVQHAPRTETRQLYFFCIGVVVFGKEYFFGGGIQAGTPSMTPYGRPVEIVDLGETQIPQGMLFIIDKSRDPFSEW
jgi:hypothetical protein